jgi:hypothetical protein
MQVEVIRFAVDAVRAEAFNPRTLFLFGSYTIGKERLFLEVARQLRMKVRQPAFYNGQQRRQIQHDVIKSTTGNQHTDILILSEVRQLGNNQIVFVSRRAFASNQLQSMAPVHQDAVPFHHLQSLTSTSALDVELALLHGAAPQGFVRWRRCTWAWPSGGP